MSRIRESVKALRYRKAKPGHTRPKLTRKVIPLVRREEIVQQHMLGKTQRRIARETGHSRDAVAKIIAEADIPSYVQKLQSKFVGLGELAIETIANEIKKGNHELAYRYLKDIGVLVDQQARKAALTAAGVSNPSQLSLTPESRDLILASLSDADRRVFRVLQTFREKSIAYGLGDNIDLPEPGNSANPSETAGVPDMKGA